MVKTVLKEIMKVETSKQIRSLACCSTTIESKSHLVAPAVSTECPVIQEDAHRRLSQEEHRAFDLAIEEERETARTMVSRLHVELGHSGENTHTDSSSLQPKGSAAARVKKLRDEDYMRLLLEFFMNQARKHHIMVDAGTRAASVTIHRVMGTEHGLGNLTGEIMLNTLLNHWIKCYGKPNIVRPDPHGAFRDQGF